MLAATAVQSTNRDRFLAANMVIFVKIVKPTKMKEISWCRQQEQHVFCNGNKVLASTLMREVKLDFATSEQQQHLFF